jgi:hypothetical protein
MRVAILSESPADEIALRVIAGALLGEPAERPSQPLLQRSWPNLAQNLGSIARAVYFNFDAAALLVVADSDGAPIRRKPNGEGRAEFLERLLVEALADLVPRPRGQSPLLTAVGMPAPAIEAWLLAGKLEWATEDACAEAARKGKSVPMKREMKRILYGTERPSLQLEIEHMRIEARRLSHDLTLLEQRFPSGFFPMAQAIRNWRSTTA